MIHDDLPRAFKPGQAGGPAPFPQGPADDLLITPYVVTETCYLVSKYGGGAAEINLVEDDACGHVDGVLTAYPPGPHGVTGPPHVPHTRLPPPAKRGVPEPPSRGHWPRFGHRRTGRALVHLTGDPEEIAASLQARDGHSPPLGDIRELLDAYVNAFSALAGAVPIVTADLSTWVDLEG